MLASKRLLEIEEKFEAMVERIVPVEIDGETLRVVLHLFHCQDCRDQDVSSLQEAV